MIKDLAVKNRSYRAYDRSRRITRQELVDLVDMTRYVASSVNDQPLKYYIACDEKDVAKVQKMTVWAKGLPELNLP
ncbi:MAG: nitroreductase family protein, partial [Spirochaetales bacterium]|nr:nitroreductase family protein [Spirochaetales bacterium]